MLKLSPHQRRQVIRFDRTVRYGVHALPLVVVVCGLVLVHFGDGQAATGGSTRGEITVAAGLLLWLLIALIYAQRRKFRLSKEAVDGCYYEFDGLAISVMFDDQRQMWMIANDVADLIKLPRQRRVELFGTLNGDDCYMHGAKQFLSEAGVTKLLAQASGRQAARLERYLINEVFSTHNRRRVAGTLSIPASRYF